MRFIPVNVTHSLSQYLGKECIKIFNTGIPNKEQFVKISELIFKNGTIELEVTGKPTPGASPQARGFLGIAFRIEPGDTSLECFYLRMTNARANEQVRRNHTLQYISHPAYPWHKLREEFPEKYESYVDLDPDKWIKLRIEVKDSVAKLFVNGATQPNLIVNSLLHGADKKGTIGLWVAQETEAYFSKINITKQDD